MSAPRVDHTDFIEKELEKLVRCHGEARVRRDLAILLPRARWQDWQRLSNLLKAYAEPKQAVSVKAVEAEARAAIAAAEGRAE